MDIDQFKSMKVEELKSFLRRRGLRLTGKKDVLVARAFVAIENNIPIDQTAEKEKWSSISYRPIRRFVYILPDNQSALFSLRSITSPFP